jgi:hypothetical protein
MKCVPLASTVCQCEGSTGRLRLPLAHEQSISLRPKFNDAGHPQTASYLKPHSLKPQPFLPMPRQNRVTPFGEIVAVPEHGTMMGNRGRIHDKQSRIRRPWQVTRWLLCLLEFHGRHRIVMAPNTYTELFFLDEATGFAAGHRPCFECRRKAFEAFAAAFAAGNRIAAPTANLIDARLHAERVGAKNSKKVFRASAGELPDGTFVALDNDYGDGEAHLVWRGRLLKWSASGYVASSRFSKRGQLSVLTPRSTVRAIRAGYRPDVHPSADSLFTAPL